VRSAHAKYLEEDEIMATPGVGTQAQARESHGVFHPATAALVAGKLGHFARRKPLGAFGALVIVVLTIVGTLAPLIAPFDPVQQMVGAQLEPPSAQHWLGTDNFGRDMFSRIVWGARISLFVAVGGTILSIIPSTLLGISCAYFKGTFDLVFQRVVDATQAIPGLILLITIVSILGNGMWNVIFALALPRMITGSRIKRAAALSVATQDYVLAAQASGAGNMRIMVRHVLPNIMATVIVVISLGLGGYILAEASLSFLGYGIAPPAPSWGNMMALDARRYMITAPHMFWAPTIALSLVIFGVNMFGDAMRDVLDPRLRGSERS
jgi:peptide/nickel transport system permease protein